MIVSTNLANECRKGLSAVPAGSRRVVQVDPFSQQVLCLLSEAWWVIVFRCLRNPRVHHEVGPTVVAIDHGLVVGADHIHQLGQTTVYTRNIQLIFSDNNI